MFPIFHLFKAKKPQQQFDNAVNLQKVIRIYANRFDGKDVTTILLVGGEQIHLYGRSIEDVVTDVEGTIRDAKRNWSEWIAQSLTK